jgi:hypothetical protein
LRLPTPIKPMQATLMEAPVTAAKISIITAVGYLCILATLPAHELPAMARLATSAISLPRQLWLPRLVLQ